jgi:hypothetical protein
MPGFRQIGRDDLLRIERRLALIRNGRDSQSNVSRDYVCCRQSGADRTSILSIRRLGNEGQFFGRGVANSNGAMTDRGEIGHQSTMAGLRVDHNGVMADKRSRVQKHGDYRQ